MHRLRKTLAGLLTSTAIAFGSIVGVAGGAEAIQTITMAACAAGNGTVNDHGALAGLPPARPELRHQDRRLTA